MNLSGVSINPVMLPVTPTVSATQPPYSQVRTQDPAQHHAGINQAFSQQSMTIGEGYVRSNGLHTSPGNMPHLHAHATQHASMITSSVASHSHAQSPGAWNQFNVFGGPLPARPIHTSYSTYQDSSHVRNLDTRQPVQQPSVNSVHPRSYVEQGSGQGTLRVPNLLMHPTSSMYSHSNRIQNLVDTQSHYSQAHTQESAQRNGGFNQPFSQQSLTMEGGNGPHTQQTHTPCSMYQNNIRTASNHISANILDDWQQASQPTRRSWSTLDKASQSTSRSQLPTQAGIHTLNKNTQQSPNKRLRIESAQTRIPGGVLGMMRQKRTFFRGTAEKPLEWKLGKMFTPVGYGMLMLGVHINGLLPMTDLDQDIL